MEAFWMPYWWKTNLDNQFEGVEPCIICYSVRETVHMITLALQHYDARRRIGGLLDTMVLCQQ